MRGFKFVESDFDQGTPLEVQNDDGSWMEATLYRYSDDPTRVALWFEDTNQYEGLDREYRYVGQTLKDGDGDKIVWRNVVSGSKPAKTPSVAPIASKIQRKAAGGKGRAAKDITTKRGFKFVESDFDQGTPLEVQNDDGSWMEATLYRHSDDPTRVTLWFEDTNQYEGLDREYRYVGQALTDGDGDKIVWRNVVSGSKPAKTPSVAPTASKIQRKEAGGKGRAAKDSTTKRPRVSAASALEHIFVVARLTSHREARTAEDRYGPEYDADYDDREEMLGVYATEKEAAKHAAAAGVEAGSDFERDLGEYEEYMDPHNEGMDSVDVRVTKHVVQQRYVKKPKTKA